MNKPGILVLSLDTDPTFNWMSIDWPHPRDEMIARAREVIGQGKDVPDTIRLLEQAGFHIERSTEVA